MKERPGTVARTLRETFGVGLSDLGDGLSWGEAKLLLEEAAADPSTALGAELAGWAYPASTLDLLGIVAQFGKKATEARLMPWQMAEDRAGQPTPDEIAEAEAALAESIVFT